VNASGQLPDDALAPEFAVYYGVHTFTAMINIDLDDLVKRPYAPAVV
jgi:hypothetical protein